MKESDFSIADFLKSGLEMNGKATVKNAETGPKKYEREHESCFLKPKPDDNGIIAIQLKFMPTGGIRKDTKEEPVHVFTSHRHFFRMSSGQYFVENCPNMVKKPCPICQYVSTLYKGNDDDKDRASMYGKKTTYITNAFILRYPADKEKEKKVFLIEIQKNLFPKIIGRIPADNKMLGKIDPTTLELKFNPWNPYSSPIFFLKATLEKGKKIYGIARSVLNFNDSAFKEDIFPISKEVLDKIYPKCVNIQEMYNWNDFKVNSYDFLKDKFEDGMSGKRVMIPGMKIETMESIEKEVDKITEEISGKDEEVDDVIEMLKGEQEKAKDSDSDMDMSEFLDEEPEMDKDPF